MLHPIECCEFVDFIRKDKHVWAIVQDIRDLLHLLDTENFTSGVVWRIENEDLSGRFGEFGPELLWVKSPNSVISLCL